ncbi:TRAP transporter small permease [Enterocloster clostridioformis]|uniref:TRAP transporter small permease n=1 Tax=Enterocloster clostridioformis TaxID=1531 RepID=UPI00321A1DFA
MLFRFVFNLPLAWTKELSRYVFIILTYCGASAAVLDNAHVRVELYLGIWTVFWSSRRRLRRKWLSGSLRRLPERKWWPRPLRTVWPQKPPLISTGLCKTKKKEIRAKQEKSPASVNPDAGLLFAQHGRFLMGESPKCA